MSTIKLFCSTRNKEEQDLKFLSLGQLKSLVENQSTVDVIKFSNEEEYLKAKESLHKMYNLKKTKQMLLVIECNNEKFKKRREVHHV